MQTFKLAAQILCISLSTLFTSTAQAQNCEPSAKIIQTGKASFYGRMFHGRKTANGEIFNMNAMTAASNTFPMGTILAVRNKKNGRTVTVRINDTGGFKKYNRVLDLSRGAAEKINMIKSGVVAVDIHKCKFKSLAPKKSLRPAIHSKIEFPEMLPPKDFPLEFPEEIVMASGNADELSWETIPPKNELKFNL